jgi:hypothetical protein
VLSYGATRTCANGAHKQTDEGEERMGAVYVDTTLDEQEWRRRLYEGELFVFSPDESSAALCRLAREMSEEAFAPHQPEAAQESMPPEEYMQILADLKPRFIHHPEAKKLIAGLLSEVGCDIEKTYFDVPRLRTMAHVEYLKSGLALQFHAHRDTWFSAPQAQLNWWLPVYAIESDNSMAFHLRYFAESIKNSSADYDYEEWNRTGRQQAATQVGKETRKQPEAQELLELEPSVRLVPPVGGMILFSAAHLHSTVPNTTCRTRFSIDFRTVNLDDLEVDRGAPNVDAACTGTTLRDFSRASDLSPLPDEIVQRYNRPREAAALS